MKRRELIRLLGGAAAAWPIAALAQQPDRMRRIGVLMGYAESDLEVQAHIAAFREGLVASFARPGGNVTGFTFTEPTMAGKWLELLKEIAPRVVRIAMLFNPVSATYADYWLNPFRAAAPSFAVEAIAAPVRDTSELESVIAAQAREPNGGLIAMPDSFTDAHRVEITSLAARYRLPAVYPFRFFAEVGGLLSHGVDRTDNFRRAATYVDRILKGEKPADLPVQTPTKYELVINMKTAKALGLPVPPTLLARADEVIE
jgi:putative ABC transport system substrate-binding protein